MTGSELDRIDDLAEYRDRFVPAPGVVAYLDGNSLGRPLNASAERLARFATEEWGIRLIRGWDEGWMQRPQELGDRLGVLTLGAASGQTVIGDSTTVLIYKTVRAALELSPGRDELVIARDDFPTDRYVLEGIASERGATLHWIDAGDVTPERVAAAVGPRTAAVLLSHVTYRSGFLADAAAITRVAHDAGALIIWDLCHSAGVVDVRLDEWGADLAVGCTYKYLNGGPGSPAFAYVAERHHELFRQPIQGWLGSAAPFEMEQGYRPAEGIRRMLSGTPPVIGMLALHDSLDLIEEVGVERIRAKSMRLTAYAVELSGRELPDARLATPRDPERRGGHVTLDHPAFHAIMARLWERGVIPDFRRPDGIRLGLSPLSTSFAEVEAGVSAIGEETAGIRTP